MKNTFGAEYIDTVEAPAYGGARTYIDSTGILHIGNSAYYWSFDTGWTRLD